MTRYLSEHHTVNLISAFLFASTTLLFVPWAGAVAARLREAEGAGASLYLTFLSGVTVTFAVNVCASFILMALSGRRWTLGDASAQILSDIVNYGYIFTGFGSLSQQHPW